MDCTIDINKPKVRSKKLWRIIRIDFRQQNLLKNIIKLHIVMVIYYFCVCFIATITNLRVS
jgi:hypothetical protein